MLVKPERITGGKNNVNSWTFRIIRIKRLTNIIGCHLPLRWCIVFGLEWSDKPDSSPQYLLQQAGFQMARNCPGITHSHAAATSSLVAKPHGSASTRDRFFGSS